MKVYKFGGASVKDVESVKNVGKILSLKPINKGFIVVSAMGKTTNELEKVLDAYQNNQDYKKLLNKLKTKNLDIAKNLIKDPDLLIRDIKEFYDDTIYFLEKNKSKRYGFNYDQIVSIGEFISTKILSHYLNEIGVENKWLDARDYIITDDNYREASVNWEKTERKLNELDNSKLYIIQGFIGANDEYLTTTLGREGSDYTGAILAYCKNAESLTIWKDVPGVMNSNPKEFSDAKKLDEISYKEAIELTYYGASVIHPKTLQPLQQKEIPLYVKSFENPENSGTFIGNNTSLSPEIPCYMIKENQIVLEISTKDFSFIKEKDFSIIFDILSNNKIKTNLIQLSAISLSLCIEDKHINLEKVVNKLEKLFKLTVTKDCFLFTIRHGNTNDKKIIPNFGKTILEQSGNKTLQMVIKK